MPSQEDLEKLFDAALHERTAPSRFGTPVEQRKTAPAAFLRAEATDQVVASPFQADSSVASPFVAVAANVFQAAPAEEPVTPEVVLDQRAASSLDHNLNAELEAILDKKIASEKGKKRRDRFMVIVLVIGAIGGGVGWLVTNPEKAESIKKLLVEIRMAMDPTAVADKYKDSLDKVAKRKDQLSDASSMLGTKASADDKDEDPGMDKEMKEIAGEGAGLSASERQKLLNEKFEAMKNKSSSNK